MTTIAATTASTANVAATRTTRRRFTTLRSLTVSLWLHQVAVEELRSRSSPIADVRYRRGPRDSEVAARPRRERGGGAHPADVAIRAYEDQPVAVVARLRGRVHLGRQVEFR